jgi:hypothetical protein
VIQFLLLGDSSFVKLKILIGVAIAFLLFRIGGLFCWSMVPPVSSSHMAQSPDKRYIAKVSTSWHGDFWGSPREYNHILVESAAGQIVRRVFTDDSWTGWPKEGSIQWATNSTFDTVTFETDRGFKMYLILDFSP